MWMSRDPAGGLTTAEKLEVVRDLARLNPRLPVSVSGAEPLHKPDEFVGITGLCRELGLPCTATTNGTLLGGASADRLLAAGPACCRYRKVPPLPAWFLALPVEEQLRRWQEALDRGDYEPYSQARDGVYDWTIWVVPDIVGGSAGSGLPYGLRELPPREDDARPLI